MPENSHFQNWHGSCEALGKPHGALKQYRRNEEMTYQSADIRTVLIASLCTIAFSTLFMLSSVGPAIA